MPRSRSLARAFVVAASMVGALAYAENAEAAGGRKPGPFMANLKIGPAINLDTPPGAHQFALELEFGVALDHAHNLYLSFPPQFQFGSDVITINLPISIQYDVELPVRGLYLYPKFNLGGAIFTGSGVPSAQGALTIQPEFGLKYLIVDNFHIGFEPISLPMYLGNTHDAFGIQYRLFFYGGANF